MHKVRKSVTSVRKIFGESESGADLKEGECYCQAFFELIVIFATKFGNALKDNAIWKDQVIRLYTITSLLWSPISDSLLGFKESTENKSF